MNSSWPRAFGVGCAVLTVYFLVMGIYAGTGGRVDDEVMPWYVLAIFVLGTASGKLLFGRRSR